MAGGYVPLPGDAENGPGPWSFADPDWIRALLGAAGHEDVGIEPVEQPLRVGDDADDVLAYYRAQPMARSFLDSVPPDLAGRVLAAIRTELAAHETPEGVVLSSAAWLVTARRAKIG